jgi:hypothetical protein
MFFNMKWVHHGSITCTKLSSPISVIFVDVYLGKLFKDYVLKYLEQNRSPAALSLWARGDHFSVKTSNKISLLFKSGPFCNHEDWFPDTIIQCPKKKQMHAQHVFYYFFNNCFNKIETRQTKHYPLLITKVKCCSEITAD